MNDSALIGIFEQLLGVKTTKTISLTEVQMNTRDEFSEFRYNLVNGNYRSYVYENNKLYFVYNKVIVNNKAYIEGKIFHLGKSITRLLQFPVPAKGPVNIDFVVNNGYIYLLVSSNLKVMISPINYSKGHKKSFLDGKKVCEPIIRGCKKILKATQDKIILQKKDNSVVVITSKLASNSLDYILN
jgi:hypothetical protein